ncbi:Abi family protein [Marinospirillum insulare]|uniref:ABC transporter permease n=1 Tax=Marinospirillum insulare TaxID=217169 RepID=A0ABQ5ZRV4_9GAMM|nr:Abi family protein [Marinospirillum insulare]GLR62719.1 ABC transporter permease [Marinospirillum insulare]
MRNFTKPVIDVEQQIAVLKQRGLSIQNEAKAKLFLQSVSFFRLSAYMRPYQINHDPTHRFRSGATFKQITQTYEFDRKLRLLVMAAIERVEVSVRAVVSNYLGPKYNNPHWYLDRKLFKQHYAYYRLLQTIDRKQSDSLKSYQRESQRIDKARDKSAQDKKALKVRRAKESYARHYPLTYSEPDLMPGWAMLEELTLGDLSHLYAGLAKDADKKAIARAFGLSMPLLESWLKTLTTIRNICAHHSRLWNRELGIKPELPKHSSIAWPDYQQSTRDNTRVAVIVSLLQYFMLQISPHDDWKNDLIALLNTYAEIDQARMGFPEDWQYDPFWSTTI